MSRWPARIDCDDFVRLILGAGAGLLLAAPWLGIAQPPETPTSATHHFTFEEKPRHLEVVSGILGVQHAPELGKEVKAAVTTQLSGWLVVQGNQEWSLFAHPSASHEVDMLPTWEKAAGTAPDVENIIGELTAKIAQPALYTPLFRDPLDAEFGLLVGSTIMIRFEKDVAEEEVAALLEAAGTEIVPGNFERLERAYLLRSLDARSAFEILDTANWLGQQTIVEWAQPNFSVLGVRPNGPCLPLSPQPTPGELGQNWWDDGTWGINISGAWASCGGADSNGPLVTVGVIGDGVDLSHPDLSQPMIGDDFVTTPGFAGSTGGPVTTCDNHETAVAGMIAMVANGSGGVGSAPKVRIASARAHFQEQIGTHCSPTVANPHDQIWTINALEWLYTAPPAGAGAKVVNYSWNYYEGDEGLVAEITAAHEQHDVLFVSSVGNGNDPIVRFPSNEVYVLGVGAIDETGRRWRSTSTFGSNFGEGLRYAAPGAGLFTTDRQGAAGYDSGNWVGPASPSVPQGTSFAAPLVAGVAALVRAARLDLSAAEVDMILCTTAVKALPFWDRVEDPQTEPLPECGLVDAEAALAYALTYDPVLDDDYETGDFSRWSETGPP